MGRAVPRPPLTRLLLVVLVLVMYRAVEMRTGWPEWRVVPLVAFAGALALDLADNPRLLLSGRRLAFYAIGAVAVGILVFALM